MWGGGVVGGRRVGEVAGASLLGHSGSGETLHQKEAMSSARGGSWGRLGAAGGRCGGFCCETRAGKWGGCSLSAAGKTCPAFGRSLPDLMLLKAQDPALFSVLPPSGEPPTLAISGAVTQGLTVPLRALLSVLALL